MKNKWKYHRLLDLTLLFLGGVVAGGLVAAIWIHLWRLL